MTIGMSMRTEVCQIITLLKETPPKGFLLSGWETDKKIKRQLDQIMCGLKHGPELGKPAQKREEQEWALEKQKLDNARRLRGISSTNSEDAEYRETIKKRKKKVGSADGSGCAVQEEDHKPDSLAGNCGETRSIQQGS